MDFLDVCTIRSLDPWLLCHGVRWVAVVSWCWVSNSFGLSISKSHPLIEVRAVFHCECSGISSNCLKVFTIRSLDPWFLSHGILWVTVITWCWVSNSFGLAISKSHPLIEVGAVFHSECSSISSNCLEVFTIWSFNPLLLLLGKDLGLLGFWYKSNPIELLFTVPMSFWVWDSSSDSVSKEISFV